jgi:menaquinone-dependent protoporphyrinogen IX oxidase
MRIEYYHASKYGNGGMVAEEFKKQMAALGIAVAVHHVREATPKEMPPADLYVFSSPGRFGKPIGEMQRFLKNANLLTGTKYAVVVTELRPKVDSRARMPAEEEIGKCQRVIPVMNQILQEKGLIKAAETKFFVTGLKGPLEEGWKKKVEDFVSLISGRPFVPLDESQSNTPIMPEA